MEAEATDRAVARLTQRMRRAGVDPPSPPPRRRRDLDDLVEAIAPVRLPATVERWWRTVDTAVLRLQVHPRPCGPDFALHLWRSYVEEFTGVVPRCLVGVAYEGHVVQSVEGVVPDRPGAPAGHVYRWAVDEHGAFAHQLPDWTDVLECYVDVIDAGAYRRSRGTLLLDGEVVDGALRARATGVVRPPGFAGPWTHFTEPLEWPEHWRHSTGIRAADRALRGRTLTVGEILGAPHGTRLAGTLVARVVWVAGQGGHRLAIVDDGTGAVDVSCPPDATGRDPGMGRTFELDVVADTAAVDFGFLHRLHRATLAAALGGDRPLATELAAELARWVQHRIAGGAATATATGVRPVD